MLLREYLEELECVELSTYNLYYFLDYKPVISYKGDHLLMLQAKWTDKPNVVEFECVKWVDDQPLMNRWQIQNLPPNAEFDVVEHINF